jgi:hypothetical protein
MRWPAHRDADAARGLADPDVVSQARDDGEAKAAVKVKVR